MKQKNYTVLLVEDDEDDFFIIDSFFADITFCQLELVWMCCYNDALQYFAENIPDLLLVDYNLNESRTGVDLVRELKGNGTNVPSVLVTGQDKDSIGGNDIFEVVDGYLHKRDLTDLRLQEMLSSMLNF